MGFLTGFLVSVKVKQILPEKLLQINSHAFSSLGTFLSFGSSHYFGKYLPPQKHVHPKGCRQFLW